MRDPERLSYAVVDPDTLSTPWRRHRFSTRVIRINFAGEEQQVTFVTPQMRDAFLTAQSVTRPECRKGYRQGPYGSHQRDRHLVNKA
jgi:flagellar biosynthesis regulator FlbT